MPDVYEAHGDIDLATAPAFGRALRCWMENATSSELLVGCRDVDFMDSAAFHVLAAASRYASTRGQVLVVRDASSFCAHMLRVCDWDNELTFEQLDRQDMSAAAARAGSPRPSDGQQEEKPTREVPDGAPGS